MAVSLRKRLSNAWHVFRNRSPTDYYNRYNDERWWNLGIGSSYRPDRSRLTMGNERSIIASIYNQPQTGLKK